MAKRATTPQTRPPEASDFEPAFRLDLEQQRKRAKELRLAFLAGDTTAQRRFRQHHPAFFRDDGARPGKLADAQLVIAREIGLPSWPKLKAHILAMRQMRDRIERGTDAPDADPPTLHIRCGSDIKSRLAQAGFTGDFMEYSDPLCHGPIVDDPSWVDHRARFVASTYGAGVGRSEQEIAEGLTHAEADLRAAASRYARVVLWFEHDGYDQVNLSRCLAQFAATPPATLEMVTLEHYPGAMRFIGLGQLPPEALRLLWNERQPVSAAQVADGSLAWSLLRQSDPTPLAAAATGDLSALPYLARAMRRHCQELPWSRDGLSLLQRLILERLAERPHRIGEIFRDLMLEHDPLPFLSDLMLKDFVAAMQRVTRPVFTAAFEDDDRRWYRERLTITPLGLAVLAGEVDFLSLSPPERWLGGVRVRGDGPCWRWDESRGTTVRTGPPRQ
jgi:hypothetical protein